MSLGSDKILSALDLERYRVRQERTLPVKGKKEFAPSGSWVERKQVEAARYERHALLKEERVERVGTLSVAEWDEKMNVAVVTYSVGKQWENFGHQQGQIKCLNPEEALFLLETSNLLLLHNNVGLSVQQGYNTLLGQRTGCTLGCYRVFSHLARQGFRLKRHDGPLFVLTEYERRIGLQSYLYPSKRGVVSTQEHPSDRNGESASTECHENTVRQVTMAREGNDGEMATNYINNQHANILPESLVKSETITSQASEENLFESSGDQVICNTIKNEDSDLQTALDLGCQSNNTISDSTGVSLDVPGTNIKSESTNIKSEKQDVTSRNRKGDIPKSHQRNENSSEIPASKISPSTGLVEENIQNIKHEQGTDDFSHESVKNDKNNHENKVVTSDIEMKVENGLQEDIVKDRERIISESVVTSDIEMKIENNLQEDVVEDTEGASKDMIKKETVLAENNYDISLDSTDSPSIIESVEEIQEIGRHLNNRELQNSKNSHNEMAKKENLKTLHEVCLISDSSVSQFSDIIVDHEEEKQNKNYGKTNQLPLVNLVSCDDYKLRGFQSEMRTPQELVIIDELPVPPRLKTDVGQPSTSNKSLKCEVDLTDTSSTKESVTLGTMNRKTVGGQKSLIKKSLKCEIDITDVSSAEESMSACPDITCNKKGDEIFLIDHKHKPKRKRSISHRRSSVKSEKSYVVDVETGTLMHTDENLAPRKVAKREKHKETSEVIVVDDIDTQCENDEAVVLKDDDIELELSKFYEEITLIDLTVEDSRTKTRAEILDMFPNFAGVKTATVRVPPSELLPENVTPSQQEYQIDLQNLITDRPNWIVRRHPHRGRGAYQRFRQRRGYFRRQQFQGSPHYHMADERNFVDPQVLSEEFSRNVRMDYDEQPVSQNFLNAFSHPAQENMTFAVLDTSGDFSHVQRFEHQQRFFPARSNKQWYDRTWHTGPQSDGFMQPSDSPSASPQHYELMNVDNRFAGHRHNQQRWNRRYHRHPSNRRNPTGRSKFRSSHHPAPHRHASRTVSFQEQTTEYDWQNIRNVSENAENWSHFKKLLSGKNCEEPSVEPDLETSMKLEDDDEDEEEEELQMESLDEEDDEEEDVEWKPLLQPSDCTDIGSILKKLNVFKEIPYDKVQIAHYETKVKINYDIYLPTTKFKKSSPCLPDYRLCVIGCEEEVPSAGEISFLLKDLKDDVPLLFAVVVPDSVAFYNFVNISLPVDDSCPI